MKTLSRLHVAALSALAALSVLIGTVAEAQGYRVRPGDRLTIEVLQDTSLNREILVTPDGTFSFPFAGTVTAAGRTPEQISQAVAGGIASNFATPPNVFVGVQALRPVVPAGPRQPVEAPTINVYFVGEVNDPGIKALEPGATLLQALATNGGFTNFAALKRLQLRRTDRVTGAQTVTRVNYQALSNGAALARDIILADGDVILVPQRRLFE